MYSSRPPFPLAVAEIPLPRGAACGAPTSNALTFRGVLDRVRLHRVERVRRIRKPPRRKIFFKLPQKRITFSFASKFNSHSTLVIWRRCRRRAKRAATQSPQPGQCRPSQLINHGWLLPRGRKTKKITRPKANTINSPMESATKKVRQLSAPEPSPSRTAPRHARNSCATRGNRNPKVATAAKTRPQRMALRMEPASVLESTGTR